jgi:hypothetical protein
VGVVVVVVVVVVATAAAALHADAAGALGVGGVVGVVPETPLVIIAVLSGTTLTPVLPTSQSLTPQVSPIWRGCLWSKRLRLLTQPKGSPTTMSTRNIEKTWLTSSESQYLGMTIAARMMTKMMLPSGRAIV